NRMPRGIDFRRPLVSFDGVLSRIRNHRLKKSGAFLIIRRAFPTLTFQQRHHPALGREDEVTDRMLAIFRTRFTSVLELLHPCDKLPAAQELCAIIGDDGLNRQKGADEYKY